MIYPEKKRWSSVFSLSSLGSYIRLMTIDYTISLLQDQRPDLRSLLLFVSVVSCLQVSCRVTYKSWVQALTQRSGSAHGFLFYQPMSWKGVGRLPPHTVLPQQSRNAILGVEMCCKFNSHTL